MSTHTKAREDRRARGCARKVRYPDEAAARKALRRLVRCRPIDVAALLNAYPCGHCGGWHVGKGRAMAARPNIVRMRDDEGVRP